ncbi:S-formylglutathione hydrolase [Acetobacteraceae bacterium ESL0709]|nr:S-formylglutathione hydrolase [Acetobacteraceae bacterium ESL0697]MDF7678211.1 S-formylglutathione hydrolase [Acetobacteraceae bacterium ESL0709]
MGDSFFEVREFHPCCDGELRFLRFPSVSLASKTTVGLYLPPNARKKEKCPVIYCLSGLTSTYENFIVKANVIRFAAQWGFALVAPDTSPRQTAISDEDRDQDIGAGAGFYVDATAAPWAKYYRMAHFIGQELPTLLEEHFPLDPEKCGVMGHSMGGMGALSLALRNPCKWKSVSAFAPIGNPASGEWGRKVTEFYFGGDSSQWEHYDPCLLLGQGRRHPATILIDQGLKDEYWDRLRPEALAAAIEQAAQPAQLRLHESYDHSYWFVQSFIEDHIAHHAAILGC